MAGREGRGSLIAVSAGRRGNSKSRRRHRSSMWIWVWRLPNWYWTPDGHMARSGATKWARGRSPHPCPIRGLTTTVGWGRGRCGSVSNLERVAQFRYTGGGSIEQVVRFRSNPNRLNSVSVRRSVMQNGMGTHPCLNHRLFVRQEAQAEVSRPLAVESKTIHTLCGIGGKEVFQEQVCESWLSI